MPLSSDHYKLGLRGTALIKKREELRFKAYKNDGDVWTIGWGSTRGVTEGMEISLADAESRFAKDIALPCSAVNALDTPLTQSMFDALVSLLFNVGQGAVVRGTVIGEALRRKKYFEAWRGFALWTKMAGGDVHGLASRRADEMLLFMQDHF